MIIFKKKPFLRSSLPLRLSFKLSLPAYAIVSAFFLSVPCCSDAVDIKSELKTHAPTTSSESTGVNLQLQDSQKPVEKVDPTTQAISEAIDVKPLPTTDLATKVTTVTINSTSPASSSKEPPSSLSQHNPEQRDANKTVIH